jgi:hypothetical protein
MSLLRDGFAPRRPAAGLFLCHAPGDQVLAHFDRLRRQSAAFVDWTLVADAGHLNDPRGDEAFPHPSIVMPWRFGQARALGRLTAGAGMMDTVIMPLVLAGSAKYVWAMEYDVDYSGHWARLFRRLSRSRADVLTTTLLPRTACAEWALWHTARAPDQVSPTNWFRSFGPLLRLSKTFAQSYIAAVESGGWEGHYEFTIPTIARHLGFRVEDLAHAGLLIKYLRQPLYHNTPADETLSPGTFVWRPARTAYFHQQPETFLERNRLYHPVKPA